MKAFKRSFAYVWPQWPKLIIIASTAVLIGVLFSFSIGTVLPLLKVMMGEEGLHGWVNRKISESCYGLSFYVPDKVEFSDPNVAYYLRVADVEPNDIAYEAGLRAEDIVVGAGSSLVSETTDRIPSDMLLEELATAPDGSTIEVQYRRFDDESGQLRRLRTEIRAGKKPFYAGYAYKLLEYVPREQTGENKKRAVIFIILLMAVVTTIRCAARFLQDYTARKLTYIAIARLREDAFGHSLNLPVGFFDREGTSDTLSRLLRDTEVVGIGIKVLLGKTLREPIKAISLIVFAMWIDHNLTLIFLCGAPLFLYAITKLGKKIRLATKKSLINMAKILGKIKEALDAIKVVKVYNQQDYETANFITANRYLLKQQFRIAKVNSGTGPLMETLGMMAGSVGLVFGAHWVYGGTMQASDFFTLLVLLGATAEAVRKTGDVWPKFQQSDTAAERVYAIIDEKLEVESPNAFELTPLKSKIEFKNVGFTYPGSETPVLKDINLSVEAGHNVAIVGPNGSGKTTLANLIPRYYDPDTGQVLIDGENIRDATFFSLRSQIGMVTQNVVTFNQTIAANIAYGKPDATEDEIVAAAKRSFAHEFIAPLPDGYDTIIGEQGAGLSGGQLQRIVIARAILKNPAILIFDEATSQVDADSEAKIHKAIGEIMQDRTSFIIAHRFSTVISADMIVVMGDGRIIAQGQHDELMRICPLYQSLYETQLVRT